MRNRNRVGRPSHRDQLIMAFVRQRSVRLTEIRQALGLSSSAVYYSVNALVDRGSLQWVKEKHGNARLVTQSSHRATWDFLQRCLRSS